MYNTTGEETNISRYPKILYTQTGQEVKEKLWEETLEELQSDGASKELLMSLRELK
jgi:hypothetical protein